MAHYADADLITRTLLYDDRNAYGALVRRHSATIRSFLRKLTGGDFALADDLAQETFVRAYQKLSTFRGQARFSSWLFRIATNLFLSHCRRAKRRTEVAQRATVAKEAENAAALAGKERTADEKKALHLDLEKALGTLTEKQRVALSLAYFSGLSHREAAALLACPVGTFKSIVLRAKEKLRPRLAAWKDSF
jgi:RNA polymerase sigma-70 factor (ECF subfamily)